MASSQRICMRTAIKSVLWEAKNRKIAIHHLHQLNSLNQPLTKSISCLSKHRRRTALRHHTNLIQHVRRISYHRNNSKITNSERAHKAVTGLMCSCFLLFISAYSLKASGYISFLTIRSISSPVISFFL